MIDVDVVSVRAPYFIVYGNVQWFRSFRKETRLFTGTHLVNHVPMYLIWPIFGFIDLDEITCTPGGRKLLYMISATGLKTILHT